MASSRGYPSSCIRTHSSPEVVTTEHIRSNMFLTSIHACVGLPSLKWLPAPVACLTARFATTDRCIWLTDYEAHVCVEPLGSRCGFAANISKWYVFVSILWAPCRAYRCAMQRMTTPCAVEAVATRTTNLENVPMCTFSTFFSGPGCI